jgi:uncharacterized protein (DUF697 family)
VLGHVSYPIALDNKMEADKLHESSIRAALKAAKALISKIGGLKAFRNHEWLLNLVEKTLANYIQTATPEFFRSKYPDLNNDQIAQKLIDLACKNAALAGGLTGAAISADELLAILTAGEAGIGVPANITICFTAIATEALFVTGLQLQLVARLAVLYGVPLQMDDPEDIWVILAFASGGGLAEWAGKEGMQIGRRLSESAVRQYIRKEVLEFLQQIAKKLGYKLLRRTIIGAVVPGVSIAIGAVWNKKTTRKVGEIAIEHFKKRREAELTRAKAATVGVGD